jgi:RNA exonuclease 4
MKHKSTLKRGKRFRRHTRKKSVYGGMKSMAPRVGRPLSAAAPEWRPVPEPMPEPVVDPRVASAVAIDCEMVGVGPKDSEGRTKSALAHVAIVDFDGNEIYNKYVIPKGGINSITNYRTNYSGIRKNLLENKNSKALPFETVKSEVHAILKDKLIVGHGLINDFEVLEYDPPEYLVWDTTKIPEYLRKPEYLGAQRKAKKLRELAANIGNNIQRVGYPHSPLEDARASMNLYRMSHSPPFPKAEYGNMAKNMHPIRYIS